MKRSIYNTREQKKKNPEQNRKMLHNKRKNLFLT